MPLQKIKKVMITWEIVSALVRQQAINQNHLGKEQEQTIKAPWAILLIGDLGNNYLDSKKLFMISYYDLV